MHVATLQPLQQLPVQQIAAALLPAVGHLAGTRNTAFAVRVTAFCCEPLALLRQPMGVMRCFLCAEINLTMILKTTDSGESSANVLTDSGESSASVLLAALSRSFPEERSSRLSRQFGYGHLHAPRQSVHCGLFDHTQDRSIIMQDGKIRWSTEAAAAAAPELPLPPPPTEY